MNVDHIIDVCNRRCVAFILIGGMNFMLRHAPVLTYDVDLWIEDTPENLANTERALAELNAEWGNTDADWGPVDKKPADWLSGQAVFCLTSPFGAIDVFRTVRGLAGWRDSFSRAVSARTAAGVPYVALSDEDMLRCQYALDESSRNRDRIAHLEAVLERSRAQP